MPSSQQQVTAVKFVYWKLFRIIFVIFSLYLIGDVFYRWDGFRYHSSFLDFLPSVALISILWSVIAALLTLLLWVPYKVVVWCRKKLDWKIKDDHILLFTIISMLLAITAWIGKHTFYQYKTSLQLKLIVFLCVLSVAIFLSWLLRNRTALLDRVTKLLAIIQQQITPIVWIFGLVVLISMPIVVYKTMGSKESEIVLPKFIKHSSTSKERPNIILVTYDALAARNMSVYGYGKNTTPFISKWAREASLFARLQAASNWTGPTCSSLMTGKRVWTHQKYDPHIYGSPAIKSNTENIVLELKKNGYYTMAFIQNSTASVEALGIKDSFDLISPYWHLRNPLTLKGNIRFWLDRVFHNKIKFIHWIIAEDFIFGSLLNRFPANIHATVVPPEKVFYKFFASLDNKIQTPFFAWIHLLPPHDPFLPPPPYMQSFNDSLQFTTKKTLRELKVSLQKHMNKNIQSLKISLQDQDNFRQADLSILVSRYNEFIRYIDNTFKDFIDELGRKRLKNTVIMLSADHGESFKHGYIIHGGPFLYEQVTNIPLIIKSPGQKKEQIINTLIEQIDISATILDFANIPRPTWMEGRSLVPLLQEAGFSARPVFSMNFENNPRNNSITKGTIAVWEDDYKLIYYLEEQLALLFNLKQDPDELNNIFEKDPEVGEHLLRLIQHNLQNANEKIIKGK